MSASPFPAMKIDSGTMDGKEFLKLLEMVRCDQLSVEQQQQLVDAMNPTIHRSLVQKYSSLNDSVVMTFKKQLELVDTVLRRIVKEDGSPTIHSEEYEIGLKDAMNLSLKVTQIMVRDMPKVYGISRIQKQEEALRRVMRDNMTPEQQEKILLALEAIEAEEREA